MDETQKALDDLKALISKPPVLASPEPGKTLLLYITATAWVINVALVVEREELGHVYKIQPLVYYIRKVLSDCETCYNQLQKLLYAILVTKYKLMHYFESHPSGWYPHLVSEKSSGINSPQEGSPSGRSSLWGST
jgi:hypothetical protein